MKKIKLINKIIFETDLFILLLALNIFAGIFTFFGYPILLPALELLNTSEVNIDNFLINNLLKILTKLSIDINFFNLSLISFFLISLGIIITFITQIINSKVHADITLRYTKKILETYPYVKWNVLSDSRSGDLISSINRECAAASETHLCILRLLNSFIFFVAYILVSFFISYKISTFVIFIFLTLFFINFFFSIQISKVSNLFNKKFLEISNNISSFTHNKKLFKSSHRFHKFVDKILYDIQILRNYNFNLNIKELSASFILKILSLIIICIIFLNFKYFNISAPKLIILMVIFSRLHPQFSLLANEYNRLFERLPYFENLKKRSDLYLSNKEVSSGNKINDINKINLRDISFQYEENSFLINNINLSFEKNTTTVIFGKSGSGKSTILDIILGLIDIKSGSIEINNINLKSLDIFLYRSLIGFIGQKVTMLDASIKENLMLFKNDINEKDLEKYIKICQLDSFIRNLPDGLNTLVGENGVKISGGQAQRIALCRSLILNSNVLLVDEVTSNLDAKNKSKIIEIIKNLSKNKIIIIVTHDLEFIDSADKTIIMDEGKIIKKFDKKIKKEDIIGTIY